LFIGVPRDGERVVIASVGAAFAQPPPSDPASYCAELKGVVTLAIEGGFASITGKPREGNFSDTTLPLMGWKDCSLYGSRTYTCDSREFATAEAAEQAQAQTSDLILACLDGRWPEVKDRSSPGYVVLHPAAGPASITISLDQTDQNGHVVRLIVFLRSR